MDQQMTPTFTAKTLTTLAVTLGTCLWQAPTAGASTAPEGCILASPGYTLDVDINGTGTNSLCDALVKNPHAVRTLHRVPRIAHGNVKVCYVEENDSNISVWDTPGGTDWKELCKDLAKDGPVKYMQHGAHRGPGSPAAHTATGTQTCVLDNNQGRDFNIVATGKDALKNCRTLAKGKNFKSTSAVSPGSTEVCDTTDATPTMEIWGHPTKTSNAGDYCTALTQIGTTVAYLVAA
jgi:hypothetical protein